ncbi:MAG: helix-turn-helix transcriptional regulator [Anaerolineae bacterium]|nr:helix-turn-helix transcriptional regulator [Anaerolineae bacterium]
MNAQYQPLADKFKALAHPARLQIVDLLRGGELCVCHIEAALGKRQAYVSQQLMALREAGVVESRRDGLQVYYWIVDPQVEALLDLLRGPLASGHHALDGCPCPQCSTVNVTLFD